MIILLFLLLLCSCMYWIELTNLPINVVKKVKEKMAEAIIEQCV